MLKNLKKLMENAIKKITISPQKWAEMHVKFFFKDYAF